MKTRKADKKKRRSVTENGAGDWGAAVAAGDFPLLVGATYIRNRWGQAKLTSEGKSALDEPKASSKPDARSGASHVPLPLPALDIVFNKLGALGHPDGADGAETAADR